MPQYLLSETRFLTQSEIRNRGLVPNLTTSPTMQSVGPCKRARRACRSMVASVPTTRRSLLIVPFSIKATGVAAGRPWAINWLAISGKVPAPM